MGKKFSQNSQTILPFAIMATSTNISTPAAIMISNLSSRLRRGGDATVSSNNAFPHPDHVDAKYHLPTPPTSISPSLAPVHKFIPSSSLGDRQGVTDSDVSDIGVGGVTKLVPAAADGQNLGQHLATEAAGAITPALLAKYHLPGILLQHGPLAIRHLTAHLISNIPGFSSIPPAKQRRLVVGALEGRGGVSGSEGEAGGVNGDVIFEKVGWGRWDARQKGDPPRDREGTASRGLSPASAPSTYGVKANGMFRSNGLLSAAAMNHSTSYTGESGIFVQSEEEVSDNFSEDPDAMEQDENEADMMSLDEHNAGGSSEEEDADMTDEEDWAQMGAALLRRQAGSPITSEGCLSGLAGSPAVGYGSVPSWQAKCAGFYRPDESFDDSAAALRAREEREAVEALVKLSSV